MKRRSIESIMISSSNVSTAPRLEVAVGPSALWCFPEDEGSTVQTPQQIMWICYLWGRIPERSSNIMIVMIMRIQGFLDGFGGVHFFWDNSNGSKGFIPLTWIPVSSWPLISWCWYSSTYIPLGDVPGCQAKRPEFLIVFGGRKGAIYTHIHYT